MSNKKKNLYIIDGYSLIYRSYFAFMNRPLRDMEGNNVSALFGFFNTLLMIVREYPVDYLVIAMDTKGPTFRHELYSEYKANRDAAPQDLHEQVPKIQAILDAAHIAHIGISGNEADDIIASLSRSATNQGIHTVMVTGDKDLLQLVNEHVSALRPPKKGESRYREVGTDEVIKEFGISPDQIIDFLALTGDSSDNVPGVSGIGPKGALKLLEQYPTLQEIYDHIEELSPGVAKKLTESKEMAFLSKELVTLKDDVYPVHSFEKSEYRVEDIKWDQAIPLFEQAQAKSLIAAIENLGHSSTDSVQSEPVQKKGTYHLIDDIATLKEVFGQMSQSSAIAFDLETTSTNEMEADIVGFSFTNKAYEAWYVPFVAQHKEMLDPEEVRPLLMELLVEKNIPLIGQNLKYDYKVLRNWGIPKMNLFFDTMVAAWIIDSASPQYNIDFLAQKYLDGYTTVPFSSLVDKGGTFKDVRLEDAVLYGAEDSDLTFRLYEIFHSQLEERNLLSLFQDIEMPLVTILSEMELKGILLDTQRLKEFSQEVNTRIKAIEEEIYDEVGFPFNINSTKQLQEVLFEMRGLTPIKKIKTGYSTDTDTLEQLAHLDAVPALILQNRTLVKLANTYIEPLPALVDEKTHRLHTSYTQTGTATGRLSSRNPNLQNIPVRNEDGKRIREAFVAPKGSLLLSADYSQIELVVLAHLSQDKQLMQAFVDGEDIHTHTASIIFEMMKELVTPEQRRIAKTINFGVMYGMSAFRLSNELGITRKHAQQFIDDYFNRFSSVKAFMASIIEKAQKEGKVHTMLQRERFVPEINSRNNVERSQGERIAVNTVIQGSAADIMKLAMIKVVDEMEQKNLHSRLLLQVHDELIFEVPEDELSQMRDLVVSTMEGAYPLSIPLKVSVEVGPSWGEMK